MIPYKIQPTRGWLKMPVRDVPAKSITFSASFAFSVTQSLAK